MKILKYTAIAAAALLLADAQTARATVSANPFNDIIVGFASTNSSTSGTNVELDLGNIYALTQTVGQTTTFNINTDLNFYGSSGTWYSSSTIASKLFWGAASTNDSITDPNNASLTLFVTQNGSPGSGYLKSQQSGASSQIGGIAAFLNGQSQGSIPQVAAVPSSSSGSWSSQLGPGVQFGLFSGTSVTGRLSTFKSLPLYEFIPTDVVSPNGLSGPQLLGNIGIDSLGNVTFTSSVSSAFYEGIPEPSTWVLVGLGALGVLSFGIRRRFAATA